MSPSTAATAVGSPADAVVALLERAARAGSTLVSTDALVRALVTDGVADPAGALEAAVDSGLVLPGDGTAALARLAMAEDALADDLGRLLATAVPLTGTADEDGLDSAQQRAVARAESEGVSVLTAGPGTGRTTVLRALAARPGAVLTAPVPAAAARLREELGVPAVELGELLAGRSEARPLEAGLVVVDDAQLLDLPTAAALAEALPDGAHLVLAGDPEQLGSAGPGAVLADLVASRVVPTTALGRLHRRGPLHRFLAEVRTGALPEVDDPTREVVLVAAGSPAEAAHRAVQLVTDSLPRALGIAPDAVLVVCPDPALGPELRDRLPGTRVTDVRSACGHRAEGCVVVLTADGAARTDRAGLLTTLSRGRRHLSVVTAPATALEACVAAEARPRRTGLVAALRSALPEPS